MQQWGSPLNANYRRFVGDASAPSLQWSIDIFVVNRRNRWRLVNQGCSKRMICGVYFAVIRSKKQKYRRLSSLCWQLELLFTCALNYWTGNGGWACSISYLSMDSRVQGRLTFFTLNSLSYSIHNLEGSMFISEQDTRINPRGGIHLCAPVDIPLWALGVLVSLV